MNIKVAASILGLSQTYTRKKLRDFGFKSNRSWWYVTDEQLQQVMTSPQKVIKNCKAKDIEKEYRS